MRYCDLFFFSSAGGWVFGYIEDGLIEFVVDENAAKSRDFGSDEAQARRPTSAWRSAR